MRKESLPEFYQQPKVFMGRCAAYFSQPVMERARNLQLISNTKQRVHPKWGVQELWLGIACPRIDNNHNKHILRDISHFNFHRMILLSLETNCIDSIEPLATAYMPHLKTLRLGTRRVMTANNAIRSIRGLRKNSWGCLSRITLCKWCLTQSATTYAITKPSVQPASASWRVWRPTLHSTLTRTHASIPGSLSKSRLLPSSYWVVIGLSSPSLQQTGERLLHRRNAEKKVAESDSTLKYINIHINMQMTFHLRIKDQE